MLKIQPNLVNNYRQSFGRNVGEYVDYEEVNTPEYGSDNFKTEVQKAKQFVTDVTGEVNELAQGLEGMMPEKARGFLGKILKVAGGVMIGIGMAWGTKGALELAHTAARKVKSGKIGQGISRGASYVSEKIGIANATGKITNWVKNTNGYDMVTNSNVYQKVRTQTGKLFTDKGKQLKNIIAYTAGGTAFVADMVGAKDGRIRGVEA